VQTGLPRITPARVKIDHIVNLQDARYVAAAEVGYLSLCLERGHIRKLPETTAWEILDWINGPQFILDFGLDHPAAEAYVRASIGMDVWIQIACPVELLTAGSLPPAHVISVGFDSIQDLTAKQTAIQNLIDEEYRIELAPHNPLVDAVALADWCSIFKNQLFLQTDGIESDSTAKLLQLPFILSFRRWVEADTFTLDYDLFENLISEVPSDA
jgi:hypothetical protein